MADRTLVGRKKAAATPIGKPTKSGADSAKRLVSVILPTYNEHDNIVPLIRAIQERLAKTPLEILVVDDESPDGTADVVREARLSGVRLIVRKERGLASAIKRGIVESKGSVIVIMDTDFNHHPRYLPALIRALDDADCAVGSRFVKGGAMEGARLRWACSYLFNIFVMAVVGVRTRENLSGFLAIRKETLAGADLDALFRGYGEFHIRLSHLLARKKLRVVEIPVVYGRRRSGESKTNFVKTLFRYILTSVKLRCNLR